MDTNSLIEAWEPTVPVQLRTDPLWRSTTYRLATFAADFVWDDVTYLSRDPRTVRLAEQLYAAVGSIGANYAEGYSRSTDRDRCRFYGYSHGSTREALHWIYCARRVIHPDRAAILLDVHNQILRMLTTTIVRTRARDSRLARGIRQKG